MNSLGQLILRASLGLVILGGCASADDGVEDGASSDDNVTAAGDKAAVTKVVVDRAKRTFKSAPSIKGYTVTAEVAYFVVEGDYAVVLGVLRKVDVFAQV